MRATEEREDQMRKEETNAYVPEGLLVPRKKSESNHIPAPSLANGEFITIGTQ